MDNIISPTITNGITITIMALVGATVIFLAAQAVLGMMNSNS